MKDFKAMNEKEYLYLLDDSSRLKVSRYVDFDDWLKSEDLHMSDFDINDFESDIKIKIKKMKKRFEEAEGKTLYICMTEDLNNDREDIISYFTDYNEEVLPFIKNAHKEREKNIKIKNEVYITSMLIGFLFLALWLLR